MSTACIVVVIGDSPPSEFQSGLLRLKAHGRGITKRIAVRWLPPDRIVNLSEVFDGCLQDIPRNKRSMYNPDVTKRFLAALQYVLGVPAASVVTLHFQPGAYLQYRAVAERYNQPVLSTRMLGLHSKAVISGTDMTAALVAMGNEDRFPAHPER